MREASALGSRLWTAPRRRMLPLLAGLVATALGQACPNACSAHGVCYNGK